MVIMASAGTASASLSVGSEIKFNNREGTTGGGEFGISLWSDPTVDLFRTFCVEVNQYMNFSSKFVVTGINTYSVSYANNSTNPLTLGTSVLYQQFVSNATNFFGAGISYDYTSGTTQHVKDANALQQAIWHFQNQPGYSLANLTGKALAMVNAANSYIAANNITDVGPTRIMNLRFARDGADAQDQLYLMPEQGATPTVPEPMSLLVWGGMAFIGLAWGRGYLPTLRG
jgi:hypothetical protein